MGIFRRGGIWWMRFTYNGAQVRRSTETADRKLAQRIYDKIKGEVAEGKWFERLPGEDFTFGELIDKYLSEYSSVNKAASSHKRERSIAKNLKSHFKDFIVTGISSKDISDYKIKRRGEGASPRTINYELAIMSHAFNIAIRDWEWLKENPVKKVSREKEKNKLERWLTMEEEERLLDASPKWLCDIMAFAINTGFRQSEILDLKWFQIDFERRTVTISEQKNKGVDTLPLNETVMQLLRDRVVMVGDTGEYVFPNKNNDRKGNRLLMKAFYTALKKSDVKKFRFHDLRHTFATRLVQNGVDLYTVQKLGRWKTISMVMRYAHHYPESLRSGIEVMDKVNQKKISTNLAQLPKRKGYKPELKLVTC